MPNIFEQSLLNETERRNAMFAGDIFREHPTRAWSALADFARARIAQHFGNLDPRRAQHELSVESFVQLVAGLKTDFTNHPETKQLVRAVLTETGHDVPSTVFDVPRLRVVTSDGYLSAGVGYAYKTHRDTWYAAPSCQVNWWASLYDLEPSQSLTFYPAFFTRPCANTSAEFDYDDWQRNGRTSAVRQISKDTRQHPLPLVDLPEAEAIRLVMPADHYVQFSAAQLHRTTPNSSGLTRFSIDFRTINLQDYELQRGAPNADNASRGSTISDFLRATDFSPLMPQLSSV